MDGKTPNQNSMKIIQKSYSYEADILNISIGMLVLEQLFYNKTAECFSDIVDNLQILPDERQQRPIAAIYC